MGKALSENTLFVMAWSERMAAKTGIPEGTLCEMLAHYYPETDAGDPSDTAVRRAKQLENDDTGCEVWISIYRQETRRAN